MGHYYSEMSSAAEIEREEKQKRERKERIISKIQKAIDEVGLASVLADIIDGDTIHYKF